jgi:hypothetical protein
VLEADLTFFEKQIELTMRNSIELSQMSLRLIPKVFNAVNVIFAFSKFLGMIDSQMLEFGDVKGIVRPEMVSVNDAVSPDFPADNRYQRFSLTS